MDIDTSNLQVVVNIQDLQTIIFNSVCKAMAEHTAATAKAQEEPATKERYYTITEVCDLLHITRPTLWRWANADYLKPIKVGNKSLYKAVDVEQLMKA